MQSNEVGASNTVRIVKSVQFTYSAPEELRSLFETFRLMCNDAIRIALQEKPKSRFSLQALVYPRLKEYGLHSHYSLSACEVAYSVYKNKRRRSAPYIAKAFVKLDCLSYQLNHLLLRIPTTPRNFIILILRGSGYHMAFLDDTELKRGSVTITAEKVSIAYSKKVLMFQPLGRMGIDTNERNLAVSATNGYFQQFDQLGEVVEIKSRYRDIRAKVGMITRQDRKLSRRLYSKYGTRERHRTVQRIHKITKEIVQYARENRLSITMEKLTGIRRLYKKGNGQGATIRGRMNSWVFGETQRQTHYKAMWEGVPIYYVNPRGTSRICPSCGSRVAQSPEWKLYCTECDKVWDRDDLASKNIMACVVPQARPLKGSSEKERGDDGSNPSSRCGEVKLHRGLSNLTEPSILSGSRSERHRRSLV